MRNALFLLVSAILILCSFTTVDNKTTSSFQTSKSLQEKPRRVSITTVLDYVILKNCNDEWIRFPSVTIQYDVLYVDNKNFSLNHGKTIVSGTGYSESTGEEYTIIEDETRFHEIEFRNEGQILISQSKTMLTGSNGNLYTMTLHAHLLTDAYGKVISQQFLLKEDCN